MPLRPETRAFLGFLQTHPAIRDRIRAAPGKTLLYAGAFFKPVWREIEEMKRTRPELADKELLPDVLARIPAPGGSHASLLAYAQAVERQVPWKPDGFIVWRALSGIFAANAVGPVSFQIASGVSGEKVFAATELWVLLRNPKIDALTRDVLAYYQRCIQNKQTAVNVGFVTA
jgi:hypothetical protein